MILTLGEIVEEIPSPPQRAGPEVRDGQKASLLLASNSFDLILLLFVIPLFAPVRKEC